jgi:hypothetical protein
MSEKIIQIISEVNRMNDLMMFSEGKEVLNESMASALKSLRTLIRNGIGDITRYGIKEVDNLAKAMMKAKTTDEFFDLLNDIKLHDVEIAKQLRRDIFDILPESTKNKIRLMVTQIENNIDSIPENKLDDLLDDLIEGEFPNEPESVRNYMKDTLSDSSDIINGRLNDIDLKSTIDSKIIDSLVDDDIRNIDELLMTDKAIQDAFKSENEWWNNQFTRIFVDRRKELTRALQSYKIDDATKVALKGKTKNEIKSLLRKEIKESIEGNKELLSIVKDKSFWGKWSRLTSKQKISLVLTLWLGGTPTLILLWGFGALLKDNATDLVKFLTNTFETFRVNSEIEELGLFTKLEEDDKEKILSTILKKDSSVPNDMFDEHGNLVEDKYMINYSTNNDKIEILDISNNYTPVKTYTTDEINRLIKN